MSYIYYVCVMRVCPFYEWCNAFYCRTSSQANSILTSQLKATNGLVGGTGLDLTPPLSNQLSTQDIQGLFINHVGYTQPGSSSTQNLQIVKREPEDLSHHRKLENSSPSLDGSIIVSKQPRHKVRTREIYLFIYLFIYEHDWYIYIYIFIYLKKNV